jgi:hypothetical protein
MKSVDLRVYWKQYFSLEIVVPCASEVTLGTHQLTNPTPKPNLHVLTKKTKECPRCVHIGDLTCCCVGSDT